MATEIEIHPVQSHILKVLLFKTGARFSELNITKLSTDHFNFHLKQLITWDLIRKNASGLYELTPKGKEFANRFDTETLQIEKQAKIGALVVATKTEKKVKKYLIQKRLKQPYFGFHGFITGKIRWGETLLEAALRELKEETNLTGKISLKGIIHKMDYNQEGKILEDKYFYVFKAEDIQGELIANVEGGLNFWSTKKEILSLPDLFGGIKESIDFVNKNTLQFFENKFTVETY